MILFPALAYLIFFICGENFLDLFYCTQDKLFSIPIFIAVGIIVGLIVIYITDLPYFDKPLSRYKNLLSNLKINIFQAFFLSFCAGFGEEVFFRGAVQPYLGIWLTAIFFVAIHGYFSYKNIPLNVFGIGLTLFIALIGWSAKEFSLWHAIAAHFSYDLVLLMFHRHTTKFN